MLAAANTAVALMYAFGANDCLTGRFPPALRLGNNGNSTDSTLGPLSASSSSLVNCVASGIRLLSANAPAVLVSDHSFDSSIHGDNLSLAVWLTPAGCGGDASSSSTSAVLKIGSTLELSLTQVRLGGAQAATLPKPTAPSSSSSSSFCPPTLLGLTVHFNNNTGRLWRRTLTTNNNGLTVASETLFTLPPTKIAGPLIVLGGGGGSTLHRLVAFDADFESMFEQARCDGGVLASGGEMSVKADGTTRIPIKVPGALLGRSGSLGAAQLRLSAQLPGDLYAGACDQPNNQRYIAFNAKKGSLDVTSSIIMATSTNNNGDVDLCYLPDFASPHFNQLGGVAVVFASSIQLVLLSSPQASASLGCAATAAPTITTTTTTTVNILIQVRNPLDVLPNPIGTVMVTAGGDDNNNSQVTVVDVTAACLVSPTMVVASLPANGGGRLQQQSPSNIMLAVGDVVSTRLYVAVPNSATTTGSQVIEFELQTSAPFRRTEYRSPAAKCMVVILSPSTLAPAATTASPTSLRPTTPSSSTLRPTAPPSSSSTPSPTTTTATADAVVMVTTMSLPVNVGPFKWSTIDKSGAAMLVARISLGMSVAGGIRLPRSALLNGVGVSSSHADCLVSLIGCQQIPASAPVVFSGPASQVKLVVDSLQYVPMIQMANEMMVEIEPVAAVGQQQRMVTRIALVMQLDGNSESDQQLPDNKGDEDNNDDDDETDKGDAAPTATPSSSSSSPLDGFGLKIPIIVGVLLGLLVIVVLVLCYGPRLLKRVVVHGVFVLLRGDCCARREQRPANAPPKLTAAELYLQQKAQAEAAAAAEEEKKKLDLA